MDGKLELIFISLLASGCMSPGQGGLLGQMSTLGSAAISEHKVKCKHGPHLFKKHSLLLTHRKGCRYNYDYYNKFPQKLIKIY